MIKGSCHCGAIGFSVKALAGPIAHCHCRTCRKTHSAAFNTTAGVQRADFAWTRGEDRLRRYESTPGKLRHFCGNCGAHLMAEWIEHETVIICLGALDDDPGARPETHIWVSHDAPWMEYRHPVRELTEGAGSSEASSST